MEFFIVLSRTLFFYIFILVCYRVMGKREIGQLNISDLTISILIAELVAISIENRNDTTLLTILPIVLLVFLEIISSYFQLKCFSLSKVIIGKPSIIINDGKLNIKEMFRQRYSVNDLLISLRSQNIKGIHEVDYAILETNGNLSVFKKNEDNSYPLPLVIDGCIDNKTLVNIKKSKGWLENRLLDEGLTIKDIIYAFYKDNKVYIIRK